MLCVFFTAVSLFFLLFSLGLGWRWAPCADYLSRNSKKKTMNKRRKSNTKVPIAMPQTYPTLGASIDQLQIYIYIYMYIYIFDGIQTMLAYHKWNYNGQGLHQSIIISVFLKCVAFQIDQPLCARALCTMRHFAVFQPVDQSGWVNLAIKRPQKRNVNTNWYNYFKKCSCGKRKPKKKNNDNPNLMHCLRTARGWTLSRSIEMLWYCRK